MSFLGFAQAWSNDEVEKVEAAPKFEIGAYVGFPALLNLRVGWWNPGNIPVAFRFSGAYFDQRLSGLDGEIDWTFDNEGSYQQFAGIGCGIWDWGVLGDEAPSPHDVYLFPNYGFFLGEIITIQGGLFINFQDRVVKNVNIFPMVKVGLGYRF